jgi:hypothetical protein
VGEAGVEVGGDGCRGEVVDWPEGAHDVPVSGEVDRTSEVDGLIGEVGVGPGRGAGGQIGQVCVAWPGQRR